MKNRKNKSVAFQILFIVYVYIYIYIYIYIRGGHRLIFLI